MRKVVIAVFILIGIAVILGVFVLLGMGLMSMSGGDKKVSSRTILELNLEQPLIEAVPDTPLAELMMQDTMTVHDVVSALERAADDDKVVGMIATVGAGGMGMAHMQDVRDAILQFRESGKPTIAFAESFGEFGPGNGGYYLATAFEKIVLQPSGDVGLTGVSYETMFIAETLDKLDVQAQMDQRYEYKNAMNMYTETEMTEPHREAMQQIADSQFGQMVRGIAEARDLEEDRVRGLFDTGPYVAAEAIELGLVDELNYRDAAYQQIRDQVGGRTRLLYAGSYLDRAGYPNRKGTAVALVYGSGPVTRGPSQFSPLTGQVSMGSDTVASALRAAIDDDDVEAILFRVDSPGGSYIASDTIYHETVRARAAGKPVIVSMGNLAGSGGYFVAMEADHIVAQPGTITGSIGVLGGKMVTTGLWDKVGVSFDAVRTSENSALFSAMEPYDPAEYAKFQQSLDRIYADFTEKVAAGRDLPLTRVQEIAKGRIWTGQDALEIGLVDSLGGYPEALDQVRVALELEPEAPLKLKRFPLRRSPWDELFGRGAESSEQAAVRSLLLSLRSVQPHLARLERLGLFSGPRQALEMPETFEMR